MSKNKEVVRSVRFEKPMHKDLMKYKSKHKLDNLCQVVRRACDLLLEADKKQVKS